MTEGSITKVLTVGRCAESNSRRKLALDFLRLPKGTRESALSGQRGCRGGRVFDLGFELLLKLELLIHDSGVIG